MKTRNLLAQVRARRARVTFRAKPMRRQREPRAIQLAYFAALRKVLASAKARVTRTLLPVLPELTARAAERRGDSLDWFVPNNGELPYPTPESLERRARLDAMDPGKRLNRMFDRMSESFYKEWDPSRLTAIAKQYGEATSDFQKEELRKQLSDRLGIDPLIAEPGLRQRIKDFTAENVALIKSIPQQYFDQVEQRVINGVRTGARHEDLAKEVADRFDVAESRAKLIARDQTLKFYGELNAARQQSMGVEKYVWRSSNDQRVRDAHDDFNGNTYSWDDPPGDGSPQEGTHPGTAINCRCTAEPVLDDLLEAAGVPAEPADSPDE